MYDTLSKKPLRTVADLKGVKYRFLPGKYCADILRKAGGVPIVNPISEVLNVMAVTLPLAYATYGRVHISIDLVTGRLTGRAKKVSNYIVMVMTFLFMSTLSWQLSIQAWRSVKMWEFDQLAIKIYYFPAKIALALAFIVASLVVLFQIVGELRGKTHH
ncbi:TRAP transporter small permease subunit [Thermodesulfobacteriota bacterium]